MPKQVSPPAPDWFLRAIDDPTYSRLVDVDGCAIHYLTWFDAGNAPRDDDRPGLLFIHGGGAHANWWRFIAPFFAAAYRVAAIDLSGMGDSGARETYLPETWAREIGAVLADSGLGPRPVIVGHSFGGLIAMKYGAEHGAALSGMVIVDSPVQDPNDTPLPKPAPPSRSGPRVYPDLSTALARFRLMPEQPCENAYITDFIARTSIRQTDGGWTWKFDFKVMGSRRFGEPYGEELKALECRAALIYGDKSAIVSRRTGAYMSSVMGPKAPVVEIPEAHHHVMLDQPLAFVAALRAILDGWARDPL
ncbi:MAG: alpha/beta hydrolase [Proteobacteria bacterium]|nr:alpha/beta hydrolase [Pseudomonadota bacterium]